MFPDKQISVHLSIWRQESAYKSYIKISVEVHVAEWTKCSLIMHVLWCIGLSSPVYTDRDKRDNFKLIFKRNNSIKICSDRAQYFPNASFTILHTFKAFMFVWTTNSYMQRYSRYRRHHSENTKLFFSVQNKLSDSRIQNIGNTNIKMFTIWHIENLSKKFRIFKNAFWY